jgi:hypothetical protein
MAGLLSHGRYADEIMNQRKEKQTREHLTPP